MSDETDAATIANYRRQIERAAQGDKTTVAIEQILATLTRMDDQWREMRAIVQAVATFNAVHMPNDEYIFCPLCEAVDTRRPRGVVGDYGYHAPDCIVTRARALLGGGK